MQMSTQVKYKVKVGCKRCRSAQFGCNKCCSRFVHVKHIMNVVLYTLNFSTMESAAAPGTYNVYWDGDLPNRLPKMHEVQTETAIENMSTTLFYKHKLDKKDKKDKEDYVFFWVRGSGEFSEEEEEELSDDEE